MSTEYEYAFGQWVLDRGDYKHRYLGKISNGNAIIYSPGSIRDVDAVSHSDIRPDPDPPELVTGQLVMVADGDEDDWEGPYSYLGYDKEIRDYKHNIMGADVNQYAKPYIPKPKTPESERSIIEKRLDSLEKRLMEVITQMQTLKTNTKP